MEKIIRSIKDFFIKLFWVFMGECHHEAKHKPRKQRYPKGKSVEAVYRSEKILKDDEVIGHIYTLSCPICGKSVKRSHEYCAECGNRVTV